MSDFGWGGDVDDADDEADDAAEASEAAAEPVQAQLDGGQSETDDSTQEDEPNSLDGESADVGDSEVRDDSDGPDEDETAMKASEAGDTYPEEEADPFAGVAGDSMGLSEAIETDHLRRVLVWGPPNVGKTHFGYTAPEPVAFIDTEGKAPDIAHKFDGKTVRVWQPEDYEEAVEALDNALDWLQAWLDKRDKRGTLVVDSMSIMWEWSKQHYVSEYYPMSDPADVNLKSAIQAGSNSDWKKIKEYHNEHFRKPMVQSDFHLVWTAMATEDFGEMLERDLDVTPDKPAGEKENVYKVGYILRLRDGETETLGDLEKSALTRETFADLPNPTFDRLVDSVEAIEDGAAGSLPWDLTVLEGRPSRLRGVEDDDE